VFAFVFTVAASSLTIIDHLPHWSSSNGQGFAGREIPMDKTGEDLELLVAGIEKRLLPQGFKVEPRQRVLDESGEQVAELDIVISGPLGSSVVKWLLECRDRPSGGAAPVAWIEQLVGRRERFGFDKVFAVSSTGFSKGAIDFAKSKGIVLRTVKKFGDIKDDFKIQAITFNFQLVDFAGPMQLDADDPSYRNRNMDVKRPMFKKPEESEFQHFPNFVMRNPQLLEPRDPTNSIYLFHCAGTLDLLAGKDTIRVHNVRIPIKLSRFTKVSQALLATVYSEDERVIWQEGQFEADTPKGKIKTRVQVYRNADGTEGAQLLTDEVPDGYFPDQFSVYGKN
jgi:hypothetical protein